MKIIDAHANIGWDINNIRKNIYPTEQSYKKLLEKMNESGISQAIIVPFPVPGAQFNSNAFWYDLEDHYLIEASKFSKRLLSFPAVNPNDERSVKNIKTLSSLFNIRGVKFSHQIPMKFSIDKLIKHPLMDIVKDNNLILMIHIGTGKEPGANHIHTTSNYALKVAKYYPDVKFILCHLGRLHKSLVEALNLENVYMDTAGLSLWHKWKQFIALEPMNMFKSSTPFKVIEKLMELGYKNKIVFGSDEPYTDYKEEISIIKRAKISSNDKRKIFYKNIRKLLLK